MSNLTEETFLEKLHNIQERNKQKEYRRLLKEERNKSRRKIKLPSTSKIILIFGFVLCLEIIAFCEYAMLKTGDLSALYSIVGVVATFVSMVIGYFIKSKAENTVGGIVFETSMFPPQTTDELSPEDAVG